jgi:rhamnosyltransferase
LTEHQVNSYIRYYVAGIGENIDWYEYNGAKCFNVYVPDIGPVTAVYYDTVAFQHCIDYCKAGDFLCT